MHVQDKWACEAMVYSVVAKLISLS